MNDLLSAWGPSISTLEIRKGFWGEDSGIEAPFPTLAVPCSFS